MKQNLEKAKHRARQGYTAITYIADRACSVRLNLESNKLEYCFGLDEWRSDVLTALDVFLREQRNAAA